MQHPIAFLVICLFIALPSQVAAESNCYGSTKNGRLENGVKLPSSGKNFKAYTRLGSLLGRTYVHSKVHTVVLQAYERLHETNPTTLFVYGETGFKKGGPFKPHKTHQNGLSVDFMVPVVNSQGKSIFLPTNMFNKYGYDIEFDKQGKHKKYAIDFKAMGLHLKTLHKESVIQGIDIWRVIFDPQLQPYLFQTKHGDYLKKHMQFSQKRAWVRHDDHYHVDFSTACEPL